MKNLFSFGAYLMLFSLCFSCCTSEQKIEPLLPQIIDGTWMDTITHKYNQTVNGVKSEFVVKNSIYYFASDGTFTTENEMPLGILTDGTWSLNSTGDLIDFFPEKTAVDSLFPSQKTYSWKIVSFNESQMEVLYHLTDNRLLPSGTTADIHIQRFFIKQ